VNIFSIYTYSFRAVVLNLEGTLSYGGVTTFYGRRKNVEKKTQKMITLPFSMPCLAAVLVASVFDFFFYANNLI
jgi:hypothetical protein